MILRLIFFLLFCHSCLFLQAQGDALDLHYQANEQYQNKEYEQAAKTYEQVLSTGLAAKELYFNLGNTYFQLNEIGKSILNYERALRLAPKDEDVQHNLALAKRRISQRIDDYPLPFYVTGFRSIVNFFSSGIWALLSILCIWGALALAISYLRAHEVKSQKRFFSYAWTALLLSALFCFLAYNKYYWETNPDYAILAKSGVRATNGPSDESKEVFSLPEGVKVRIVERNAQFCKVVIPDGREGWLPSNSITVI